MKLTKQQGVILVTALIFLLILTVLGITSMGSAVVTEKLSQNIRDSNTAFTAAESALSDGESWVYSQSSIPSASTSCSTPPCNVWQLNILGTFYQQPNTWWTTNARAFSSTIGGVAAQPRYVIEQYGFSPYELSPDAYSKGKGYYYYRVTSRGTGATANAIVNLQSIYATQYN